MRVERRDVLSSGRNSRDLLRSREKLNLRFSLSIKGAERLLLSRDKRTFFAAQANTYRTEPLDKVAESPS
jgi:hypothetical protein